MDCGEFYVVDVYGNYIVSLDVDIDTLSRELGVLKKGETIAGLEPQTESGCCPAELPGVELTSIRRTSSPESNFSRLEPA